MDKLIKEEINRIREVMGLRILNESPIPIGVLKSIFSDFASGLSKNVDAIMKLNKSQKNVSLVNLANKLRTSTSDYAKNFMNAVDEVAGSANKTSEQLLDEIGLGTIDPKTQELIVSKMAAKSIGTDMGLYSSIMKQDKVAAELYKDASGFWKNQNLADITNNVKNGGRKSIDDYNAVILKQIEELEDGTFKEQLLKSWEEQVKYVEDNVLNKFGPKSDEAGEAAAKQSDEAGEEASKQTDEVVNEVENVKFNQEDLNEVEGVAGTTKPIEGALANYLSKKFKVVGFDSWKKFTVEEQNRIILEMSSKINSSFERTIREYKWDSGLVSANKTIEQMMTGNLSEKAMEKVFRNAINTAKPSFGTLGNTLDGLVEFTTGISARQGKVFWTTTTGWGEVTKKWILFNLGLAVAEGTYRFYDTREEPTVEGALNILEQRVDFLGLAQRILLPLPLISRLVVSETIQAAIVGGFLNYDGFRQLTEAQINEQFDATNVEKLDVNQFPCYDTFADKLKGFSKRANYFKVNGQNKGIWALDLSSGEVVQIQTPMSDDCTTPLVSVTKAVTPAPAPAPTTTTTPTLNDFIKFIKSNDGWGGDAPQDDKAYEEVGSNKFRVVLTDGNYDYKANADGTFTYIE
jgi:hypothetical protein